MQKALSPEETAARELRVFAKQATAAAESVLRWSYQLEYEPDEARKQMRKVLAASENRTCTNPVLDMAAERGLNPLVPHARDVAHPHVQQKKHERAEGQRSAGPRETGGVLLAKFGFAQGEP